MAERRMFSARITTNSARFLRLPVTAQCLYFHMGMQADDEGVVEAFITMRQVGASEEDLKVLEEKGFIKILNEDFVSYITDWDESNKIRSDRAQQSIHHDLLVQYLNNKSTADCPQVDNHVSADCQQSAAKCPHRIGEDSIGKVKDSPTDYAFFQKTYNEKSSLLPKCKTMTDKRKKLAREFLKTFSEEQWAEVCERANRSEFLTGSNDRGWKADIDFLLRSDKAAKILEGFYEKASYKDRYKEDGEPDFLDSLDI